MSDDLISRKELLKNIIDLCGCIPYLEDGKHHTIYIDEIIKEQPIAYDVDEVISNIEEQFVDIVTDGDCTALNHWNSAINKAINIVKEGGV